MIVQRHIKIGLSLFGFIVVSSSAAVLKQADLEASRLVINKRYHSDNIEQEEKTDEETVVYNCEYYRTADETGEAKLEWYHDNQLINDRNSKSRVSVLETVRPRPPIRQLKLTLRNVKSESDAGLYECRASFTESQETINRKVRLLIIKPPQWVDTSDKAADKLGASLSINCKTVGEPKPDVTITLAGGLPLPERYIRDGDAITVNELKLEDRDVSILCTASQILDTFDSPVTVSKFISIDVYFMPEFEGGELLYRYGIPSRNVTIPCHVTKSNPPVDKFEFQDAVTGAINTEENKNYEIDVKLPQQKAFLHIVQLQENHFKTEFLCRAFNKFYDGVQKIKLQETSPPEIPSVTDLGSKDGHSTKWALGQDQERPSGANILPITAYRIKHLQVDLLGANLYNHDNPAWNDAPSQNCVKQNLDRTHCAVMGLRRDTDYAFRFQSVNEAGMSDWSRIFITKVMKMTSSSISVQFTQNCSFVSLLSACLLLVQLIVSF